MTINQQIKKVVIAGRERLLRSMPHPGRGAKKAALVAQDAPEHSRSEAQALAALRPKSLHVLMDIVNKCNLRCIMCHFTFDEVFYQKSQHMLPDDFEKIVNSIAPYTKKLSLSAAYEPTSSPHFADILLLSGGKGMEISFLTNGNLLSERLIEAILDAGVTEICFSIHAARPDTYAKILKGGQLHRVRANVARLIELRDLRGLSHPKTQLNIALMRSNLEELPEIIDLAADLRMDSVAFRHLIVFEGLGMEVESLAGQDDFVTNGFIRDALERAQARRIRVFNSPDFFSTEGYSPFSQWSAEPPEAPSRPEGATGFAPIGNTDNPPEGSDLGMEVELSGWALGPTGLKEVYVSRMPLEDEEEAADESGLIRIGSARFHNGVRSDVVELFPGNRYAYRAGWSFRLRRSDLPRGLSSVHLKVVAVDMDGSKQIVGERNLRLSDTFSWSNALRCHKPFDSLYIDARSMVYPYPDCHTDVPFGLHEGQPFEEVWNDQRLVDLRAQLVAGQAPTMCIHCPLFINREVDELVNVAPHPDFSTETRR